jgi:hypothetical protein
MVQELSMEGNAIAFSTDGRLLAIASGDTLRLTEPLVRGEGLRFEAGFAVDDVAFTPEGNLLAAGPENFAIWDPQSGELIAEQSLAATRATRISHGGDRVLAFVYPTTVDIYETTQGFYLDSIDVPPADGNPLLAVSPDLSEFAFFLYVPTEYQLQFRDLLTGASLRGFAPNLDRAVAAYSSDGRILALAGPGGLLLVSPIANNVLAEERGVGRASAVAVTADGTLVAVGIENGVVRLWGAISPPTPTPLPTSTLLPPILQSISLNAAPSVSVALPLDLRTPSSTTVSSLQVLERLHVAPGAAFQAYPDSSRAIISTRLLEPIPGIPLLGDAGCADQVTLHQVLDLASGATSSTLQVTGWPAVWDRRGERLVTACQSAGGTRFQVFDTQGLEVGHLDVAASDYDGGGFQVSDGAQRIASQPREGRGPALYVWSVEEGVRLLEVRGGRGMVLSSDGRSVFVFEGWNVDVFTENDRHFFYDHVGGWPYVLRLEVPSGAPSWLQTQAVAQGSAPRFIVEGPSAMLALGPVAGLWDLEEEEGFVPSSPPMVGAAAFSPDGLLVVFSQEYGNGIVLYFYTADGRHRATLAVDGARGNTVGFCLEGRALWVGSSETVFLGLPGS